MDKKRILVFLMVVLSCGCADTYNVYPVENQTIFVTQSKQETPTQEKANANHQKTAIKPQAIINFSGKVTLKKTNDLTAYIHKQMNEGVQDFIININSGGGDSDAGISAYQYLKQLPVSITTHNIGNVQSSASLIYCSGNKRFALPNSFFMLHGSSTHYPEAMSLSEIEPLLKLGKIHRQAFMAIFRSCSNLSGAVMEEYFSSATLRYFTATEAQNIGLVQEIAVPSFSKSAVFYNITD